MGQWPETFRFKETKAFREPKLFFFGGMRIVIPSSLQKTILEELQVGHPGVVRMKEVARSYVGWPVIDADIENTVQTCEACQHQRALPTQVPLHPWVWPTRPWARLHLAFAGPFFQNNFLAVVDTPSKWPEVFLMRSTSAEASIGKLRELFGRFGLSEVTVSDNGARFRSEEFQLFLKMNEIKHVRSASYHPSSNSLAERFVRTVKQAL